MSTLIVAQVFVHVPVIPAVITLNDISKQEIRDNGSYGHVLFIHPLTQLHKIKDTETLLSEH